MLRTIRIYIIQFIRRRNRIRIRIIIIRRTFFVIF